MPREIDWSDTLEIAIQLQEKFPNPRPRLLCGSPICTNGLRSCPGLLEILKDRMRVCLRRSKCGGMKSMRMRKRADFAAL